MALTRIGRISFTAADADRLGAFYRQGFGFEAMETEHHGGTSFARLTGIEGAQARALPLRPGEETIELLEFTQRGALYPADIGLRRSAIPAHRYRRCRHGGGLFAAVRMWGLDRDHERGTATAARNFGGVTAFKFRDPEGRPLELIAFPPDNVPPRWREAPHRHGPCLGIDHSAIVVSGTAASVALYQQVLGFSVAGGSLNRGEEQEQLDAVPGAVVEVTALDPG